MKKNESEKKSKDPTSPAAAVAAAKEAVHLALADATMVDLSWIQPPPTADGWTLAPDALRFLTALVPRLKPRHILEMGSGLSSRVLAKACAPLTPRCAISSVDHDPEFGPMAAKEFAQQMGSLGVRAEFQTAPVVARLCGGKILPQYHINPQRLASRRPADLVVIDGPPVNLGGREGTLYQAMDFARPGTLALLDDAARNEEKAAVSHWQDTLGDAIEVMRLPGFTKGMTAVLVHEVVPSAALWQRRVEMTRGDLERVIPADARFILIDQQSMASEVAPGRTPVPFLEKDGSYWGPPETDQIAIAELARQKAAGVRFVVVAWPAFWWVDYYAGLFKHLRGEAKCILDNDRVMVFALGR